MSRHFTPLFALALLASPLSIPSAALAAPPTDTLFNLEQCRGTSSEDPNIALGECVGFVQTLYLTEDGWVPHYCRAFLYFEPDAFYALYDDVPDCIVSNRQN